MGLADEIIKNKKKKESVADQIINGTYTSQNSNNSTKKKEEKKWYDEYFKESQGNGWQTFGYSALDALGNLTEGSLRAFEGISDWGRNRGADIVDFFGADDYAKKLRERSKEDDTAAIVDAWNHITAGDLAGTKSEEEIGNFKKVEENSIFGDKSDQVFQGVGNSLTSVGVGALSGGTLATPSFVLSAAGNAETEALNNGATAGEARLYGAISGAIEYGTERMFGGLGKASEKFGLGKGQFDDQVVKLFTKNMKSSLMKNITTLGIKSVGEGLEEVTAGAFNAVAQKMTYMKEEDFWDLVKDQNLMDSFVSGMLSSAIMQSPSTITSTVQGRDVNTGLTRTQQKYVNEIAQQRMVEAQRRNAKLNGYEKGKIEDRAITDFQKGRLVDASKLQQVNLPGISTKDMDLQQSAYKYGFNPNSEAITTAKAMLDNRGIKSRFDADAFENIDGNAYWTNNNGVREVVFNPNASEQAILEEIAIHELTHDLMSSENSKEVIDNQKIIDYVSTLDGYKEAREAVIEKYASQIKGLEGDNKTAYIDEEIVADTLGKNIGSQEYIRRLIDDEPSIAKNIYDWVVNKVANKNGVKNEKAYWNNVKNNFEKAYNMEYQGKGSKGNANTRFKVETTNDGLKYVKDESSSLKSTLTEKDVFNILKGTEYNFEDGDKAYIVGWLNSNDKTVNNKAMYNELFKRYPAIFKNIEDIKDFNTLVNYNTDELLKTSTKTADKVKDINNKHKAWKIDSFDTRESILYDESNDKAYIIDFSVANLKNGKKIAYAKKMAQASDDILNKIKTDYRVENTQQSVLDKNISQPNKNVKSNQKYSMSEQLEKQATNLVEEDIQTTNAMLDNFKSYLEEYDITNPTQEDIDNSLIDLLSYDNDMTPAETLKYEKQYKEVVNEYLKEQNQDVRYSLSETPTQDNQGRELTKGQQEYFKSEDANLLDENGNLKVLYHGTPYGKFTTFKGNMFFFSEDYGFADDYANSKSFEQALDGDINVVEAYIKAENVFDVTDSNDIQKLREALPNEMTYWGNTWDKETLLKKLQRKDTLPPKWKSEQIEGKQFGDYIGDDRNGYNTDMFVGVNEQNEIVYISQERDLQKLSQSEKDMFKEQLMSGKEVSYLTYQTVYGDMTKQGIQDKISDFQKQSEEYKKENGFENEAINYYIKELEQTLKWIDKDLVPTTKHKLIPKTTTQEATELTDIDNWTYFETAFDRATGKDVVDIIKDLGYDAINIYESGISNYIVFNPNQIKSVTNESPTDNPDIRKSQQNEGWQSFLDNNFEAKGTKTRLSDIKLPGITNTVQEEVQTEVQKSLLPIANELKELNKNLNKVLNPNEISQLTPQDANTTPSLPGINRNQVGDGKSKFFDNINNKVNMLSDETKTAILSSDDVKYYDKVTNKESLDKAYARLQENGQAEVEDWLNKTKQTDGKDARQVTAVDVAEGWILLKQANDAIEKETDPIRKHQLLQSSVNYAINLRDMGTKAGQAVQAFNILSRLTPEGMVYYAQKELSQAYDEMVQNKTKAWIDENKSKFELQPNEVQFILDTMREVSTMEDGRAKDIKLAQIQAMMKDKLPPSKGAGIRAWMRISMLFNPKTLITRNPLGNALMVPVNAFGDMFASGVDKLISQKTGVRTKGNINLKSYGKGFVKGAKNATEDYRMGINTRNIEGNRFELTEGKSFNDNNIIGKGLNKADSMLGYVLDIGDRTFYEGSFENSLKNQMLLNNTTEVTQDMIDIATQEALSRTWQDNSEYTKAVLGIRNTLNKMNVNGYGLGDVLIPFAKTPANLTKAIVDYSPVGLVSAITKGVKLSRSLTNGQYSAKTQHEFVESLGKAFAGTALYVLGLALVNSGIVSGDSDEDKDVSNFLKNTLGINSYSIKIGDKSFTYDWAQPIAAPLSIMANIVNSKDKDIALIEGIVGSLDSAGSILLEQSFLQSINDVLNNQDGVVSGLITEGLELPARAVPTFLKQIADLVDGTQRQTFEYGKPVKSAFNQIINKIPGLSYTLDPSVDTMGREIKKYGGKNNLFNVFLNPANVSTENVSESAQEIYRLYKETGETNIMPRVAPYYINKKGDKIVLTTQQRTQYQKVSGAIIEENVANLLGSTAYQNMSDTKKAETINDIVNYSYNIAQNQVLGTELSDTYQTAYEYAQIGDISDFYEFRNSIDDTDADTKKTSIVNYLYNSDLEDNQIANLYGNYYSSDKTINAMLELRIPIKEFIKFDSADIQGQYNEDTGKTITNSKKNATIEYVNTLNLSKAQRAILVKSVYSSHKSNDNDIIRYVNTLPGSANEKKVLLKSIGFDNYDEDVFNYINSQNISKEEKIMKLKELGFTVRNGRVYY